MNLLQWDRDCLLSLNALHSEFWDGFMWMATNEISWVAFFAILVYAIYKKKGLETILIILAIALTVLVCDQVSGIFKEMVARPRPSRQPGLMDQLHTVNGYRGGRFGFFSSHAANTFGIAVLVSLLMRNWMLTTVLFVWALIESYTRIYLGVHYPLDILTGIAFGSLTGYLVYRLHCFILRRLGISHSSKGGSSKIGLVILVFVVTVFMMMVGSEAISDFLL